MEVKEGILLDRDGTPLLNAPRRDSEAPRAAPFGRRAAIGAGLVTLPIAMFAGLALVSVIAVVVVVFLLIGALVRLIGGPSVTRTRTVIIRRDGAL